MVYKVIRGAAGHYNVTDSLPLTRVRLLKGAGCALHMWCLQNCMRIKLSTQAAETRVCLVTCCTGKAGDVADATPAAGQAANWQLPRGLIHYHNTPGHAPGHVRCLPHVTLLSLPRNIGGAGLKFA